ncbi:MAG: EFR1 family ferrodoxin [Spirochaetota bacterium]
MLLSWWSFIPILFSICCPVLRLVDNCTHLDILETGQPNWILIMNSALMRFPFFKKDMEHTMKGLICYYSGSGNTKLACEYIAKSQGIPFELVDIVKEKEVDFKPYDIAGFATFTDFGGPPYLFEAFVQGLPMQEGKPAFVFNTYGFISGKTLRTMERQVSGKGFTVLAGYSLHTPESYPPMIAGGRGNEEAPDVKEMEAFNAFAKELEKHLENLGKGRRISGKTIRIGLLNSIIPKLSRTTAKRDMGDKYVDESLCTECGTCERLCPYKAIRMSSKPVFDMEKCYGCWRCYNKCPERAIYTNKFRGAPHYPKPNESLKKKLSP